MSAQVSGYGVIIVYMSELGQGYQIRATKHDSKDIFYANVVKRNVEGNEEYAALFPHLESGNYKVEVRLRFKYGGELFSAYDKSYSSSNDGHRDRTYNEDVTVWPGFESEIDWRMIGLK